jgi:hypothetical protein
VHSYAVAPFLFRIASLVKEMLNEHCTNKAVLCSGGNYIDHIGEALNSKEKVKCKARPVTGL